MSLTIGIVYFEKALKATFVEVMQLSMQKMMNICEIEQGGDSLETLHKRRCHCLVYRETKFDRKSLWIQTKNHQEGSRVMSAKSKLTAW